MYASNSSVAAKLLISLSLRVVVILAIFVYWEEANPFRAIGQSLSQTVPLNLPFAFEADVEFYSGGKKERRQLSYDRGKWSNKTFYPGQPPKGKFRGYKPYTIVDLYNGQQPPVVWTYSPVNHEAGATFETLQFTIFDEAKRFGVEATKKKYAIPAWYDITRHRTPPHANDCIQSNAQLPPEVRPTGHTEKQAGHPCEVYASEKAAPDGSKSMMRAWVEPRSGIVVRLEVGYAPPTRSSAPALSTGFRFTRLRFVPKLPASLFEIPSGTKVTVPRSLAHIPLPKGVTRVMMKGNGAEWGIYIPSKRPIRR